MLKTLLHAIAVIVVIVGAVVVAVARGETTELPEAVVPAGASSVAVEGEAVFAAGAAKMPEPWLGVVVPVEEVAVAAPIAARIEAVHVRLGDSVTRSQVLATIDRRQLEQDLAAARANLVGLRARRAEADVELEQARDEDVRAASLGALVAEQERTAAQLRVKAAQARLDRADADVAEQKANIAKLDALRLDADVRAPFDGVVALRHVDAGAFVAGGAPLLELVGTERLLRLAVPGRAPVVGTRVQMRCDDASEPVIAIVERLSPQLEVAAGTVIAEARMELGEGQGVPAIGVACEGPAAP
jgi:multidrug efflux pump subunit AcrA (membrane-fusion protein)